MSICTRRKDEYACQPMTNAICDTSSRRKDQPTPDNVFLCGMEYLRTASGRRRHGWVSRHRAPQLRAQQVTRWGRRVVALIDTGGRGPVLTRCPCDPRWSGPVVITRRMSWSLPCADTPARDLFEGTQEREPSGPRAARYGLSLHSLLFGTIKDKIRRRCDHGFTCYLMAARA